ncbi:6-carboxytetrahydropterin synthase [Candidatus Sumerlaeota bacterium]|nr:6-carboxytetrahydropterin synthase [Candidatus Sumerlaeota bacterium]
MDASLHIGKEALKFSSAHFTIFSASEAERLHGHNYHVQIDLWGEIDAEGLIIDVSEVKAIVKALCDELDERTLIPVDSPHLTIRDIEDDHLEIRFADRRYALPRADCALLPVPNITIESLAQLLGERLCAALRSHPRGSSVVRLRLGVEESKGQMGLCELKVDQTIR